MSECAFKSRRIKGLLILTPSDRSHEALVIQVDALTPHRDDRAFNTSILQMKTVKLNILRVGNGGKVCLSVCGTVVILNGGDRQSTRLNSSHESAPRFQSSA